MKTDAEYKRHYTNNRYLLNWKNIKSLRTLAEMGIIYYTIKETSPQGIVVFVTARDSFVLPEWLRDTRF